MTATGSTVTDQVAPPRRPALLLDLARAGAAPAVCGLLLLALLVTWVLAGGGGTINRERIRVTQAAVPMPSFLSSGITRHRAPVYLTLSNLAGTSDELVAASSPAAARIVIGPGGPVTIPARSTISLSPFGPDLVLISPRRLITGQQVLLRLRFRHAGTILVDASVTAPGAP